ncbi:N-acetylmuramoyl-L-alanine amidase family protein [Brotaphodocola sp.]|uniref:N-acetylmuramoyl-L-alanine amidase family protein n=1 Tax=Brotaphodocola sp. TaxID=3073577 RepID=UPI003D7DE2A8
MRRTVSAVMAAVMTVLGAFPAWGGSEAETKSGWQKEEDGWVYLSSDGSRKTEEWIRGADGASYYVDENGVMLTNSIVRDNDRIYYVDENGARVKNRWASESNADAEDPCDQDIHTLWYYFGADGRAKRTEGKAVRVKENGVENKYFFDSDGHMLSGWQRILNNDGNYDVYYLGDEDDGHAHLRWQYLEPDWDFIDNSKDHDYDGLEHFYFGWDGKMTKSEESHLGGNHYVFDENGVMLTGWQPGIELEPGDDTFGVNKYYDKETGARASGWVYTWDPDDEENGEPHWYYCDKSDGLIYNEAGKDGDGGLAYKKIDGQTYFFDENGHMIQGLIATDGTDLGDHLFTESEFEGLSGTIGAGKGAKPAGIYYLSQDENHLGQMAKDGALKLKDGADSFEYYLSNCGKAYTNAFIKGHLYGEDGLKIKSDSGNDIFEISADIYEKNAFADGVLSENYAGKPVIPAGSKVIVNASGSVKKNGKIKVQGTTYTVKDYVIVSEED